ncbi:NFACT family protein [Leptotrichia wadei]|uniref:Fibronectin-binding A domain-containing protein n=1 Tax=Leptotrichia wadei TaxID=157687 RepID=A0A510KBV0_9FUSO|nr:NFACT family protein [Leptotrichia wadei]BBM46823.1 fibronectin-binding A domain-containing protein [Leptotrichia wadei]BBM49044.1 fibronectin-binding A domain-containing protein [Leptotrichia wadei]
MLYLDGIGISFLVKEIKEKILRYKLTKIFQYDRVSFSLFFGKNNLLFQVKDNSTIFYLKDEKDPNTDFQSKFLLSLKKHLQNSILVNIRQEGFDRIVYFDFEKLNQFGDMEKYTLIIEIMGKASNIFLTCKDKILSALYFTSIDVGNRVIMTGAKYTLPFEEKKISPIYLEKENFPFETETFLEKIEGAGRAFALQCSQDYNIFKRYLSSYRPVMYEILNRGKIQKVLTYNEFSEFSQKENANLENNPENKNNRKYFETLNEGLNAYFKTTITSNVISEKKKSLLKYVDSQIKKFKKIEKNIKVDLKKNENFENYKNIGDILAANMHQIKYGMKKVTVFDFYNNQEITINLDPLLSPNDNLNFYYNKYNKGKRTISALNLRFGDIQNEIKYFEEIKMFIEKENDFIGIEEIENELNLSDNGNKIKNKIKLNKTKKRELLSFDYKGFQIFVGRNNKENEEISFSKGQPNDIWMHIKDIPGSHVLILRNNQELPEDVLIYAANLACEYSKAKKGDKVTVDYCERKFIKKIKNSKPGNVTYTNFHSLLINVPEKSL